MKEGLEKVILPLQANSTANPHEATQVPSDFEGYQESGGLDHASHPKTNFFYSLENPPIADSSLFKPERDLSIQEQEELRVYTESLFSDKDFFAYAKATAHLQRLGLLSDNKSPIIIKLEKGEGVMLDQVEKHAKFEEFSTSQAQTTYTEYLAYAHLATGGDFALTTSQYTIIRSRLNYLDEALRENMGLEHREKLKELLRLESALNFLDQAKDTHRLPYSRLDDANSQANRLKFYGDMVVANSTVPISEAVEVVSQLRYLQENLQRDDLKPIRTEAVAKEFDERIRKDLRRLINQNKVEDAAQIAAQYLLSGLKPETSDWFVEQNRPLLTEHLKQLKQERRWEEFIPYATNLMLLSQPVVRWQLERNQLDKPSDKLSGAA